MSLENLELGRCIGTVSLSGKRVSQARLRTSLNHNIYIWALILIKCELFASNYLASIPPSTVTVMPVIKSEAALLKNKMVPR